MPNRQPSPPPSVPADAFVQALIETTHDAFVGMDAEGRIAYWNARSESLFGWSRAEALGQVMGELIVPPELRAAHAHGLARYLASGKGAVINQRVKMQALRRNGTTFPVELTISVCRSGDAQLFFAFMHDTSDRTDAEDSLLALARTDALTGLPNRLHLLEYLHRTMARVDRTQRLMALMFMDVDRFKNVNDGYGHAVGDAILQQFSDRLRGAVRQVDFVGRLGGDEFLVVLEELVSEESAALVAQKILRGMKPEFSVHQQQLSVSTSIGITLYRGGEARPEDVIRRADQAMYEAKNAGRNTFRFSSDDGSQNKPDSASAPLARLIGTMPTGADGIEQFMQDTLHSIRTHLGMDVAFISQFIDGQRVFRYVDTETDNTPIRVGGSDLLEDSYCQRVVDGRLPQLMPDTFLNREATALPVTRALSMRSHIGVPIRLKDGSVYGTYCCFGQKADASLNQRDLNMLRVFADLVARQLERSA